MLTTQPELQLWLSRLLDLFPTRRWVQMSFVSSPVYVPPALLHSSLTFDLSCSSSPVTVMVQPVSGGQRWEVSWWGMSGRV